MGNPVVFWELMSGQPGKLSAFYAKLFGWEVRHEPAMDYRFVRTGGEDGIDGGILKPPRGDEGSWPGNMVLYIAVDDLAAYRKKVLEAGGEIHVEEQQVPGLGSFCLFTDPEGRMMGLWKGKT